MPAEETTITDGAGAAMPGTGIVGVTAEGGADSGLPLAEPAPGEPGKPPFEAREPPCEPGEIPGGPTGSGEGFFIGRAASVIDLLSRV
jgi:hypothetical protein